MEARIEAVCGGLIEAFEKVSVGVESGPDRSMSEALLDHLRVLALGDQEGDVRVPQVVEAARLLHRSAYGR
jgi:hypothetical protein